MKLMGLITFINVVIGVTLGGLLYTIWPEHYFRWYPSIPIFYWVMGIVMTFILDRVKKKNGDMTVTAFMVVRFCKFTLAIVFLWLYAAPGPGKPESVRLHPDAFLLYLLRVGNIYGLSV